MQPTTFMCCRDNDLSLYLATLSRWSTIRDVLCFWVFDMIKICNKFELQLLELESSECQKNYLKKYYKKIEPF